MIPLSWYLILAAALVGIGLFGVVTRKNLVGALIGIELMLNSVNINLVAFWRYFHNARPEMDGLVFVALIFVVAAGETAIGLALIISAYRRRKTVDVNDMDLLKG
jgi:NADH:ubiquinone oxidoreductase subunit K